MAASRRDDNTQRLIVDAARELLNNKLLDDVPLGDIAKKAGVSKGTLYYYFKTKDDLLFAVLDGYLSEQWADFIRWADNPEKDTSLPRMIKYVLERVTSTAGVRMQFFLDAMQGRPKVREQMLRRYEEFSGRIAEKIALRTDKVSAEYLSWILLILADGLFLHRSIANPALDDLKLIEKTQEYLKYLF